MAHPLFLPGGYHFYPIGNTSATCFTRDLAPEEPADILLLGCGDPRSILYTIFTEPSIASRKLDFTCCDMDPAILGTSFARNVLLVTLIADKVSVPSMWNIFYHMYLDEGSHSVLVTQCRKLVSVSENLAQWDANPYASFLRMCTEYTLAKMRHHWVLYIAMHSLPPARLTSIRAAFKQKFRPESNTISIDLGSARSAGPLLSSGIAMCHSLSNSYKATGVTFLDPTEISAATLLNPTFVYSLGGECCSVHIGTNPITSYHTAAFYGNAKSAVTVTDCIEEAQRQFGQWCSAFQASISLPKKKSPIIRMFVGEATAVSTALQTFTNTGAVTSQTPVAPWNMQLIRLVEAEYRSGGAPAMFNVIDTSNLDDHLGLLNVLITAAPLLSKSSHQAVLYTEGLQLAHDRDATKALIDRIFVDITVMGLLIGLCPVDFLSGFAARSNAHEVILNRVLEGMSDQYHQPVTWKTPISGDSLAVLEAGGASPATFDPVQMGTLFYDIYCLLFEQERIDRYLKLNQENPTKAMSRSNLTHYTRGTFVLLLKLIRNRLSITDAHWEKVMDRFFSIQSENISMPFDADHFADVSGQLHRHGLAHTRSPPLQLPKTGVFAQWNNIPSTVRVILTIPRHALHALEKVVELMGTPLLQCDVWIGSQHHIFSEIQAAFGRTVRITSDSSQVSFEQDDAGWHGTSPLSVSFLLRTHILTNEHLMESARVGFSVMRTPGAQALEMMAGLDLHIFSTKLTDRSSVIVLPQGSLSGSEPPLAPAPASAPHHGGLLRQIGECEPVSVELDEQCELVTNLTIKFTVTDAKVIRRFQGGHTPKVLQISPCVMRVSIDRSAQDLLYPFPIIGCPGQYKIRVARKSLYIEVVVPTFSALKLDINDRAFNPFAVMRNVSSINPWSVHRVNLSRLPVLDTAGRGKVLYGWLNPHIGSTFSQREVSIRKQGGRDALLLIKDTIHSIFARSSGIQGESVRRVYGLRDKATTECDTILFISNLRFDLPTHGMVCDGFFLPLTPDLMDKIRGAFGNLVKDGNIFNMTMFEEERIGWKQILPMMVERCRSNWQHTANCEYKSTGRIPKTDVLHEDPICSCGRGKDVEGMRQVSLWKSLAPHVTRIALSPLFVVSYLESVGRDPASRRCFVCRGKGKPDSDLKECSTCRKVRYCSKDCQKKNWDAHRVRCKPYKP
ncbi:hypothetical protein PILCRDRAFT_75520 [Piloderma croceum F 1598]|uniref:MYND-type domain-containing protein n=1 Tax=Piloderma croceum (strain F 1598) TaxID=765440 RepID=A0A0C3BME3_PILCF|nr:hypothetical protein PILCRDRAFT_75520 [Piloderma croceum F 1598]